jgi:peptide/nickel transport system permease protein
MSAYDEQVEQVLDGDGTASAQTLERAEEARYGLSQSQLMLRKFKRSKAAIFGGTIVVLLYLMALFARFLAPYGGDQRFINNIYAPPHGIHWSLEDGFYVYGIETSFDPDTLKSIFEVDKNVKVPLEFFVHGTPYELFGFIPTDIHLFGVESEDLGVFLFGTDRQGRDMFSRIMIGSQMSLTIGLFGVILSLIIGSVMGVSSGYFGGRVDNLVQRGIEIIRAFPPIPLWMALTAALPQHWPPQRVYFAITIILSFIGWTWLARQLRGKVLSLREEEFITAAQLSGASDRWVIFRHLIPAVFGLIIVVATRAMPGMILAESALSFLNLGLRPPLISWGVLLQEAQNLETMRLYPWLLTPALFIAITVLAFNFFGDGLRDAADPYSR